MNKKDSKVTSFEGKKKEFEKNENEKEEVTPQDVFEAMNKREKKHLILEVGLNGDETPLSIKEVDGKNITLDDVMFVTATLDVNNFAHLIQRAILSTSSADEVLAVYTALEQNRIDTVNSSILNMLKTQVKINPNPIYKEILDLIEAESKQAEEFMRQMQEEQNKNSGIIIPK